MVVGAAVVAGLLSPLAACFAVRKPESMVRRRAWQIVCMTASLLPAGLLALCIIILASVEPMKGWLDEAGGELLKGIIIAVAAATVLGLLGFSRRFYRKLLSATLKRALPDDTRTRQEFNVRDNQIREGKQKQCRDAIAGIFDYLNEAA